jgi:hypothetical protein
MKTINVTFDDGEYKLLMKKKNGLSWHNFIMKLVKQEEIK